MGNDTRTTGDARRELVAAASGRIDAVLAGACPDISRARIQRLIASGNVTVNGDAVRKSGQVFEGDRLALDIPETEHTVFPTDITFPVLYEDDWLIAIDKPAGMAVHGAPGDTGPSVAMWMLERLGDLAGKFDVERPGIVHRLDKDTSGVLLLAKTPRAQAALSAGFESRTTKKTYLAITDGVPDRPRAVIDADIGRHPGDRTKMAISRSGRGARTEYEVLGKDHGLALVLVHPETGRTHQIRVHLAAIQAPVMFDRVYGKAGDGRQMLHAYQVTFEHPGKTGETLTITAPIPADFSHEVRALHLDQLALGYEKALPPAFAPKGASTPEVAN